MYTYGSLCIDYLHTAFTTYSSYPGYHYILYGCMQNGLTVQSCSVEVINLCMIYCTHLISSSYHIIKVIRAAAFITDNQCLYSHINNKRKTSIFNFLIPCHTFIISFIIAVHKIYRSLQ